MASLFLSATAQLSGDTGVYYPQAVTFGSLIDPNINPLRPAVENISFRDFGRSFDPRIYPCPILFSNSLEISFCTNSTHSSGEEDANANRPQPKKVDIPFTNPIIF